MHHIYAIRARDSLPSQGDALAVSLTSPENTCRCTRRSPHSQVVAQAEMQLVYTGTEIRAPPITTHSLAKERKKPKSHAQFPLGNNCNISRSCSQPAALPHKLGRGQTLLAEAEPLMKFVTSCLICTVSGMETSRGQRSGDIECALVVSYYVGAPSRLLLPVQLHWGDRWTCFLVNILDT